LEFVDGYFYDDYIFPYFGVQDLGDFDGYSRGIVHSWNEVFVGEN